MTSPVKVFAVTTGQVAKVFIRAMKETPGQMFSPYVAFWRAVKENAKPSHRKERHARTPKVHISKR